MADITTTIPDPQSAATGTTEKYELVRDDTGTYIRATYYTRDKHFEKIYLLSDIQNPALFSASDRTALQSARSILRNRLRIDSGFTP